MKTALVIALLLAPAQAIASCESGVTVESGTISFGYSGTLPTPPGNPEVHEHFRSLAHALAVAQSCRDTILAHSCEAGTPPRTRIVLTGHGQLEALDPDDLIGRDVLSRCNPALLDSALTLWTVVIGRFNTEAGARDRAEENGAIYLDTSGWDHERDVSLSYESCGGTWEPAAFIVRLPRATVAPWSVRHGLYFTPEDAARAAAAYGLRARITRQRVDGALLEQALREPVEGC